MTLYVKTTLEEDFKALGIPYNPVKSEDTTEVLSEDVVDDNGKNITIEEDENDPFDGKFVTKEMLDRIESLSLEEADISDIDAILDKLSEKEIDDENVDLVEQAERVVTFLKEGVANRQRRFKAGSVARKMSFQCPQGTRAISTGGGRPVCRPAHIAAGGMGKLAKESRKKRKWARGGKGVVSQMKSGRVEKRRMGMRSEGAAESFSPFALELMQITEETAASATVSVRDEIIERIVNIFEFLNEEFMDETVSDIYTEAVENLMDAYEASRLEEDVLDDEAFIAELNPVMTLITKSINRLEDGDLGNE